MQQHALIPVGDAEECGHVGRSETLDVAQHDDLALQFWQRRQHVANEVRDMGSHDAIVDALRPRHDGLGPLAVGVESVYDFVVGVMGVFLARRARSSSVQQNAEQPRRERRSPLEPIYAAHDRQPCVLAHLLRHGTVADGRLCEPEQARLVAADDLDERGLVTGPQPIDESEIVIHVDEGYVGDDGTLSVETARDSLGAAQERVANVCAVELSNSNAIAGSSPTTHASCPGSMT